MMSRIVIVSMKEYNRDARDAGLCPLLQAEPTKLGPMDRASLCLRTPITAPIKKKLHGLSPQANYTDRATAACQ
jgi:hypothetical protein